MKEKEKDYWLEYKKIFDCIGPEDDSKASVMELIPALDKFRTIAPSIIFIIDYSTMQYLYFNDNASDFLGSVAKDYINRGVAFAMENCHPDDKKILLPHIYPYMKKFLINIPPDTYKDYKFSYNFRYKRKDGTYQRFIQHSTFIPDKEGNLRYNFGIGSNLPPSSDNKITLPIEKKGKEDYQPVNIDTISIGPQTLLSKRECQVLQLLHEGLSSAAIAKKLCLSEHTINNHRKNMLKKTATNNTASLISYAIANGIL